METLSQSKLPFGNLEIIDLFFDFQSINTSWENVPNFMDYFQVYKTFPIILSDLMKNM